LELGALVREIFSREKREISFGTSRLFVGKFKSGERNLLERKEGNTRKIYREAKNRL